MDARIDNWDDLRLFLAVARAGTLSGAAREIGVNHSTVFRRIGAFEEALGVRLFDRLPSGYALTAAGEAMQESALRVVGSCGSPPWTCWRRGCCRGTCWPSAAPIRASRSN
jgi:hypothetical protein